MSLFPECKAARKECNASGIEIVVYRYAISIELRNTKLKYINKAVGTNALLRRRGEGSKHAA